jgi:predicted metal-dependent hydrolase
MSCDSIDAKHRIVELSAEQLENEKRKNKKTIQNKIQKFLNKARANNSQNDGVFFKFFRQYILENENDIINHIAINNNFLI